jgi:hypothetical protein
MEGVFSFTPRQLYPQGESTRTHQIEDNQDGMKKTLFTPAGNWTPIPQSSSQQSSSYTDWKTLTTFIAAQEGTGTFHFVCSSIHCKTLAEVCVLCVEASRQPASMNTGISISLCSLRHTNFFSAKLTHVRKLPFVWWLWNTSHLWQPC